MTGASSSNLLHPEMTVLEVIYHWRQTESVFAAYEAQAGVCLRCRALFDSLAELAAKYNLDLQKLQADLQRAIAGQTGETQ